jgi:hypothetical protein
VEPRSAAAAELLDASGAACGGTYRARVNRVEDPVNESLDFYLNLRIERYTVKL